MSSIGHNLRYDPDRIFRELEEAADKMCDEEAVACQLEEMKKPMLASLTLDHLASEKNRTLAETRALADEQYAIHVKGMVEARRRANRTKARYHNLRALAEARRTEESSIRAMTKAS